MKEIIIIDDSPVIRLTLSSVFSRYFNKSQLKIYTSVDGLQGLGYVFITRPDLIIVDLTLPKYSGKEVIDFISTNEFVLKQKIPVIVLMENECSIDSDLPENFVHICKEDENFIEEITNSAFKILNLKPRIKKTFKERFFWKLAAKLIHKTNSIDEINEKKDRSSRLRKIYLSPYLFLLQLNLSIYISLFFLFYNRNESEDNIELQKRDLARFRVRTYSAVGIALASFFVIFLQLILLSGGLFSAFIFGNKVVQAASYTWDGGGTDGTCGGNVGDGNKWSCAANWSLDIVPTSADTVTFNGTSTKNAVVDAGFGGVVTSVNIASGYTGTITLERSLRTSSTFTQSAGIFTASNQTLDVDSTLVLTGGSFTASSGSTFLGAGITSNGTTTFNANGGTVTLDSAAGGSLGCTNITFNLVVISGAQTKTIESTCNIPLGNNPTISGLTLNGTLSGTGTLTTASGNPLVMNSSAVLSGFTGLNTISGSFTISGANPNFSTYTTFVMGGSLTLSSGSITLPVGADLNDNLVLNGGTFNAPAGNMTLARNLTFSGTPTFNANGGSITLDGPAGTLNCNNTFNFNSIIISATGTNIKTLSGNCTIPLGANPTTTRISVINSTLSGSGTLTLAGGGETVFSTGSALTGFTGIAAQGFTVSGGANINLSGYTSFVQGPAGNTVTLATGSTLSLPNGADINGNLTITGGTFNAPAGTLNIAQNLTISGTPTFNANGGTVNFDSTTGGTYSCNNVTFNLVTFTHTTGTKTVNSNCTLPLGNNPTIGTANGSTGLTNNGVLTGTGTLNLGVFNFNAGSSLSGFTGINANSTFTVAGGTANLSGYTSFITGASGPVVLSSGSLSLPSGSDLNSTLTISGGTFTATSGNMTLAGALTISGSPTFNANNGTFTFDGGSATLSCNNVVFNNVVLNHTANTLKTINSNCNLPLGNNSNVSGAIVLNGTLSGTGTITLAGTTGSIINSTGNFSGFSGLNNTISLITFAGATSNFGSYSSFVSNGAITLSSGTLTLPNGADLNNILTITGGVFNAPSGIMSLSAALTISGSPTFNHNNGTMNFDGTADATLTCNNVVFNLVTFTHSDIANKTIGTNCTIPVGNNPTVTGRVRLNSATSTLTGSGLFTSTCEQSNCLRVTSGSFTGFSGLIAYGSISVDGGNLNLGSYSPVTIYGRNSSSSISTSSGGVFTAPTGTMLLYDKINNTGTFNHNNGTVEFSTEAADTSIGLSTATVTFNNLKAAVTIPSAFSFISGATATVLGTFEMKGTSGNLLSLMTDTPGVQWNLDVSSATGIDLEYLSVTDSNSINRIIQTAGLNVTDGGNNTNWNFANPEISEVGPSNLIDGSFITENKPTFEFKILDPDSSNQIKYIIQIDNNSDFSSPEVNVDSGFIAQGELTFTPTNNLSDDEYYWKIQAEDSQEGESEEYIANNGEIAFILDSTKPEGELTISELGDNSNPFKVQLNIEASDNLSGVSQMIISQSSSFTGATYETFSATKQIEFAHTNGTKTVYIKLKDAAENESDVFSDSITIIIQNNPQPTPEPDDEEPAPDEEEPDGEPTENPDETPLYEILIRLVDQRNNPLKNIEVFLDSNIKGVTDSNGIVKFVDVAKGSHQFVFDYNGQRVSNSVTIGGEEPDIEIKVILEREGLPVWVYVTLGILVLIIILGILTLLLRRRRKKRSKRA
jgi:CheY-like chemotaxis protein